MTFNPNCIIEDAYCMGYDSHFDVQGFFLRHKSILAGLIEDGLSMAWIIKAHCSAPDHNGFTVDARLVCLRLQVEQSLITQQHFVNDRQLEWCLGFGVPDGGQRKEEFRGFSNQVSAFCSWWRHHWQKNYYIKDALFKTSEGRIVHPANKGTYLHYLYTPWIGDVNSHGNVAPFGNKLVWEVFQAFRKDFELK